MINFDNRLKSLKDRRQGTAERVRLDYGLAALGADMRSGEDYESLRESSAVKYVIGAMAPVSEESTRISIAEGERVATTLMDMLATAGISTSKRMQGSVALDIHIEGHSDVDMLILKGDIVTIDTPALPATYYTDAADTRPMVEIVRELRLESETKLESRYHAADVNTAGSKSISLSGGSLQRKVDIVPSCWHDTHDYQQSKQEHHRAVKIYDKNNHLLHKNLPFLHIKRVNEKDAVYDGNLKKVIRLMKNIVADMPEYKKSKAKKLSSFDLTGIAYGMDERLNCGEYLPLTLLENLRFHLLMLEASEVLRDLLLVPDGTRKVFDSEDKLEALKILTKEVSDLAFAVQKSLQPGATVYDGDVLKNKGIYVY